ncbi:MAG: hypothetical protein F7C09_00340 [Aeropyrum sp.]|nr:hypothetical protein [Aeropyrum sp.]
MSWLRRLVGGPDPSEIESRVMDIVKEHLTKRVDAVLDTLIPYYKQVVWDSITFRRRETVLKALESISTRLTVPGHVYYATRAATLVLKGEMGVDTGKAIVERALDSVLGFDEVGRREAVSALLAELKGVRRLVVLGYSMIILEFVERLQALGGVELVVPEGGPLKSGRLIVRHARRHGMRAYYVPDSGIYWAVKEADAVVVPVYGVSLDGPVSEAGASIAVVTARTSGIQSLMVGSEMSLAPPTVGAREIAYFKVESSLGGKSPIDLYALDVVPGEDVDLLITGRLKERCRGRCDKKAISLYAGEASESIMKSLITFMKADTMAGLK